MKYPVNLWNRLMITAVVIIMAATSSRADDEWYGNQDANGGCDTIVLPPYTVTPDPAPTFDWDVYWASQNSSATDPLNSSQDDGYGTSSGGGGSGNSFATWEATQSSETHLGLKLVGSQNDINQVKSWSDSLKNNALQTVANEFNRLMTEAQEKGLTPTLRLGTGSLTIGNFDNSAIDVSDMKKFPADSGSGATQLSVFTHEMMEQLYKQVEGKSFTDAHSSAINWENAVAGLDRGATARSYNSDGSYDDTTRFTSPESGLTVDQTMHFDGSRNLTSTTSVTVSSP